MKRITLEQQLQDEVKRMIFENGEEDNSSQLREWNEMKNMLGRSTTTFVSSFIATLLPALIFCMIVIGVVIYFIMR